jgi:hypothetical protein
MRYHVVEEAEPKYECVEGELRWRDSGEDNVHVQVAVLDHADGRFVPGVTVKATMIAAVAGT